MNFKTLISIMAGLVLVLAASNAFFAWKLFDVVEKYDINKQANTQLREALRLHKTKLKQYELVFKQMKKN